MEKSELDILCENIRKLRQVSGLSVPELAKVSGVSEYMLAQLDKGNIPPRFGVEQLFSLCVFFRVPPHEIFKVL